MTEAFLSMENVSKYYTGVRALDGVDFDISLGEVHCLAGENGSGKSTLIKIISGVTRPEPGAKIFFRGTPVDPHQNDSGSSMSQGVQVIYQDLSLFPNMTVRENIALNQISADRTSVVTKKHETEIAVLAMDRIGVTLPLDELVGELSIGDQQLVAICRALTSDVSLLIMDEPTTALTRKEVNSLFAVVRGLKEQGIASLFVSHKLDEVFAVAERVTVLRNGKKVGTYPAAELDDARLTDLMTGMTLDYTPFDFSGDSATPLLEVRNLTHSGSFIDVSFDLFAGEILGITGLLGSGRTELATAIFGIDPAGSGTIRIEGRDVVIRSVPEAVENGIAYVPENRLTKGLTMKQSVRRNIVAATIRRLKGHLGFIDEERLNAASNRWVQELEIKVPSIDAPVETLSGGNQQRVVLAKWLATAPRILILDGPTVGIDVAAKAAIHRIIRELARKGIGIIVISDEVAEVYGACNRILVMHRGRLVNRFRPGETSVEAIQEAIENAI
jgi:simple sugar transport system ATP-binding protein